MPAVLFFVHFRRPIRWQIQNTHAYSRWHIVRNFQLIINANALTRTDAMMISSISNAVLIHVWSINFLKNNCYRHCNCMLIEVRHFVALIFFLFHYIVDSRFVRHNNERIEQFKLFKNDSQKTRTQFCVCAGTQIVCGEKCDKRNEKITWKITNSFAPRQMSHNRMSSRDHKAKKET